MHVISHDDQRRIWDEEHRNPTVLKQMDSHDASSGVVEFYSFLEEQKLPHRRGVEMGCGKGRNAMWLSQKGIRMDAFDFSPYAIEEAKRRAKEWHDAEVKFAVQDATKVWPYKSDSFDFGIDCFASTDIESLEGRRFAIGEMRRVLKPGGVLLAYLLSINDGFHKKMIGISPVAERNAFLHPTGKFEKIYDEQDITDVFSGFEIIKKKRIRKMTKFGEKAYVCNHFWIVFRKPQ